MNSCGVTSTFNGVSYLNAFSVTMTTSNACGQSTSGIAPIIISESPMADFEMSDTVVCVNTIVSFTNASFNGSNVTGGIVGGMAGCDSLADVIWSYNPFANVELISGELGTLFSTPIGNQWFPGTEMIELMFTQPGVYSITMKVRNKPQCGEDSITKTICVIPALVADFSLPDSSACVPYTFQPTNLSNFVQCDNGNIFEWTVTRTNPQACPYGSNPGYAFSGGTNASSVNPTINFTAPGIYQIQLINKLEFEVPGIDCDGDTIVKTLIIKDKPFFTLDPLAICSGSEYVLAPNYFECYADNGLIYNWNFAPSSASIATSSLANPSISYDAMGDYAYSLTASNECGSMSASSTVNVADGIVIQASGPTADCLNSPITLNGTITGAVTTGTWFSDLPGGTFSPSNTNLNPNFFFTNGFIGDITFTLMSDSSANGCPPAVESFVVSINNTIYADAGNYDTLCLNTVVNLLGEFGGVATSATWSSLNGGVFADPNDPLTTFTPPMDFVGDITIILTTNTPSGDCVAAADTVTLTFVPLPVITVTSDTVICEGQSLVVEAGGASSYNWDQNLGFGQSHVIAPIVTTVYTVEGTDTYGCSNTNNILVEVIPAPIITPLNDLIFCPQETSVTINFESSIPNTSYSWTRTSGAIGLSDFSGLDSIPSFTTINASNSIISSTFIVIPEADNCSGPATTFTISVNPIPNYTGDFEQIICPGATSSVVWNSDLASPLAAEFSWELISSSTNLSGLLNSGNGNLPAMNVVNANNLTETAVYNVQMHYENCFGEPFDYTFTVNPGPIMNPIPAQEICSGASFEETEFSASVVGSTFTWNLANTTIPATLSGYPQPSGAGNIQSTSIQNLGNTAYTLIYAVTPFALNCTGAPALFQLVVNPQLVALPSVPNQVICNNSSSVQVELSGNVANSSVVWNIDNVPADVFGITVTDGINTIPSFNLENTNSTQIQDITITLQALNEDPLFCPGLPSSYTISVFPTPIAYPESDSIFCHGQVVPEIVLDGLATQLNWSHNGSNLGLSNSGTDTIPEFIIQNNSFSQVTVDFMVIPYVVLNNDICEGLPNQFSYIINPNVILDSLPNIAVCNGDSVPQINFSSPLLDGSLTYSWQNSNTSIGLSLNGSGVSIPSFLGVNTGTTGNVSTLTFQATYVNSGVSCLSDLYNFEIAIHPIPQIVYLPDTFICNYQNVNVTPITNINSSFVWQGDPNPNVNGVSTNTQVGNVIDDQLENNSPDLQPINYYVAPILPGTNCIGDTSQMIVIVEPTIFMTSPTVYEICSGTSVNSVLTSNIPANYNWFATPNPNVLGSTNFSVSTNVINDILINTTTLPQMVVYTIIPSTISGNCQGDPLIVNVLVNPELQITSPPTHTICNNQTVNIPLTANANGTFSWFASQSGPVSGETTQIQNSNSINDQLFNNSSTVQQVTYNVVITTLNQGCTSQNFQIVVDVIPTPTVVGPTDITVCHQSQNQAVLPDGNYTSLNWTNNNTGTGIAAFANNVPNFAGFTANNTNNFPHSSTIVFTPIITHNNVSCSGSSDDFEVTVNPNGQINFMPNIEVCHGTPVPSSIFTTSNSTGTTTFLWNNNNLTTGLNLTAGLGNVPGFTSANNFSATPNVSTISAIGAYFHNSVSCPSQPITFDIIVNPIPSLNPIPNQTHCSNDSVPLYNFNGFGSNYYVWSHNNASIGLPINGFGNLPQFVASNLTQVPIQSTVQVTPYYNSTLSGLSCVGNPQEFTITIQPAPLVFFQTESNVYCSRSDVTFYNYSNANTTFNWNFGDGGTSLFVNPTHIYQQPGTYTVTLTGMNNFNGCTASYSMPISILEKPIVSFSVDSAMQCFPAIFTFTDNIQAPFTYNIWHFGDGNSVTQNDSVSHVYLEYGCYDVTLIVGSENGCMDSLTIPQMVCHLPNPIAHFTTDQAVYNTNNPIVSFYNSSQFATNYSWNFGYGPTGNAVNPVHIYPEIEASYPVVLTAYNDIGCSAEYGLVVVLKEDRLFYVPNSFTPENLDGVNDYFLPVVTSGYDLSTYNLVIFNRWGEIVFETSDYPHAWNGVGMDGKPCPDGAYVWQLTLRGILEKDAEVFTGHVMLLR